MGTSGKAMSGYKGSVGQVKQSGLCHTGNGEGNNLI